jgi:hypothetical protein
MRQRTTAIVEETGENHGFYGDHRGAERLPTTTFRSRSCLKSVFSVVGWALPKPREKRKKRGIAPHDGFPDGPILLQSWLRGALDHRPLSFPPTFFALRRSVATRRGCLLDRG